MASAKYYGHPANTKYTGVFEINETNDTVGNKSILAWSFKVFRNDNYNSSYSRQYGNRVVIVFDNNTILDTTDVGTVKAPNGEANAYVLASGTTTIDHNTDGTRSLNFSATYTNSESDSISPLPVSGTHVCNTIPRASSVSVPAMTMGKSGTISVNRAASGFTHTLLYSFGNSSGTIATNVGTSASWTPPRSLGNQIPNAVSGTGTITCITYSGGVEIGRSAANFTLSVNEDMIPTLTSLTAERIDGSVPSDWGIYVSGKSKARLTINGASGNNGSTIKAYAISGGGFTGTDLSLTTGFLNAGDITFTARVRDSRGRWSEEKNVTISVVEYFKPKFTAFGTYRCLEDGTKSDEGTYFRAYAEFAYADCGGKNTVSCTVKYKRSTTSYWTTAGTIENGVAGIFGGANIALEGSYDVQYILDDSLEEPVIYESFVSSTYYTMHFKKGGKGVAIGKTAEEDNLFDVALPSRFRESLTVLDADGNEYSALQDFLWKLGGVLTGQFYFNNTEQQGLHFKGGTGLWDIYLYGGAQSESSVFSLYDISNQLGVWNYDTSCNFNIFRPLGLADSVYLSSTAEQRIMFQNAGSDKDRIGFFSGAIDSSYVIGLYDWTRWGFIWLLNNDGTFLVHRPTSFQSSVSIPTGQSVNLGTGRIYQYANQKMIFEASNESDYGLFYGVTSALYWSLCPNAGAGKLYLGDPNNPWRQLYASTSTITTSDRNQKKDIVDIDQELASKLICKLLPKTYRMIDGDSGRLHWGLVAQDVEEAMKELGISDMDFAGFIRSQKYETYTDENGKKKSRPVDGEYIYALRYEEFIAPIIVVEQKHEKEIQSLKNEVSELKAKAQKQEDRIAKLEKILQEAGLM